MARGVLFISVSVALAGEGIALIFGAF